MASKAGLDLWSERWEEGEKMNFHERQPKQYLTEEHIEKLTDGKTGLRFLVPLCGKSPEMKWLVDQGQVVVGIEGVQKPCEEFFKRQQIDYSVADISEIPGGKHFKSDDGRVEIYNCDVLKLESAILGEFDAVFDRGAFVVMDFELRPKYVTLMKSVSKTGCKILLAVQEYDWNERKIKGPPYPVCRKDVETLFGDWCKIEEYSRLDRLKNCPEKFNEKWGPGITSHFRVEYLLEVL
ncbi:putative thiopurine S-methyltransferase [Apostichopus japonicus]|uniref:thiopurine S-methyltransferase n=1 Tax=Stichopus japonicus TaxID=307972 RepID=A0A2G8KNC6_STIJA|nr:putative thiopurine S-methyltransferase [Apostichopus japonicus]